MLSVGYHYLNETSLGAVGVEYLMQTDDTPISFFAHGRFGENDYQQVSGGLKVYFDAGPARSLIDRHRMMDPPNYTPIFPQIVTGSAGPEFELCPVGILGNDDLPCSCPGTGLPPVPTIPDRWTCSVR
jgi:hypothetical protein